MADIPPGEIIMKRLKSRGLLPAAYSYPQRISYGARGRQPSEWAWQLATTAGEKLPLGSCSTMKQCALQPDWTVRCQDGRIEIVLPGPAAQAG
jgi:hypothetical protein